MFKTVKRIINWCGDFKAQLYIGFIFSFFSYWFAAAPIVISAFSVGKLIEGSFNAQIIWKSAILIFASIILRFLFDYMRARFQESISYKLVARDRLAIGDALKHVSLGYFQKINTGNILSSITTGLTTLENMGIRMLDTFIGGYLNFAAISIFLWFSNYKIAIIALVTAIISFLFLLLVSKHSEKYAPLSAKNNQELTEAAIEYARGLPVVKSFGQGGEASKTMVDAINSSKELHLKIEWGFIPSNCLHLVALKCGSVVIALAAFTAILSGEIEFSLGFMIILFSFTVFSSLDPISDSAHVLGVIDDAMDKIDALTEENFIDENGQDIKLNNYDIEFKHVNFAYDSRQIIKDLSFKIPENTSTAIVGPSGSGKTTIVNLIARFYDVQDGEITIGGHNVREFTCDSLLSNISMVFQNVYLFNDTIRANICFGRLDTTEEDMIKASKRACCHDFIMSLPNGYDTVIGEGGGTLSGGEKQRISIARAILKNSPIIILDEATASIDPENEHLIQKAISELTNGKTVITIAHRLATIENADQIFVIKDGCLMQKGTHNDLIKSEGIYKRFVEARNKAEGWSIQ